MPARKTTEAPEEEKKEALLMENMRFYSRVMNTPKEAQKAFSNGSFSGTDINPMYRIQRLTELFGPVGFGWWTDNVRYEFIDSPTTNETHVFCEVDLYIRDPVTKEVSKPIYGIGGNCYLKQFKSGAKASDEAKKMAYTDALGIACKAIGIGHDIWYANDKTKYTMYSDDSRVKQEEKPAEKDISTLLKNIQTGITYLTKDMSAEDKTNFMQQVIVPIIGSENYIACKDADKLDRLLTELRSKASKRAA